MLEKFVTVRCVQMGGVDLDLFQFDPMLSWAVFFLHGDKTIYGRYGTAHEDAKRSKKDSNAANTLAGLKASMQAALEVHAAYVEDAAAMKPRLAGKVGAPWPWRHAEKTPAARKYKRLKRIEGRDTKGCVHCHEVQRLMIDSYFMTKRPVPDRMLWMYPFPRWLGMVLQTDRRARIVHVAEDSPVSEAGIEVGDDIETMQGQPILSPADVTWVLHQTPDEGGRIAVQVRRDGKVHDLVLTLDAGWRRLRDFAWRYRIAGYAMWLWAGATLLDHADGVRIASHAPWWFKKDNKSARKALQKRDVILAVDGKATSDEVLGLPWSRSTYLAYLMRAKEPGSTVRLRVRRGGKEQDVSFRVPKPRPEVLGH